MELSHFIDFLRVSGVYILCLFVLAEAYNSDPIITTSKGKVRGMRINVYDKQVDTFLGIPFAKPPVGNLRFKHPVPNDPWTGIYNATKRPNSCVQGYDRIFTNFSGETMWHANTQLSEDCLYLNVWVPRNGKSKKKKAVMIWIYGGGFYSGTSTLDVYDPRYLVAENDVIFVSMQYRVSAFGFLALGIPEAPGNAGMFDQLMALDWVQRNIKFFGGNPQNVTLFGESAGAVSVAFHLLSPLSQPKFNRAILQSGSVTCAWAVTTREEAFRRAKRLARQFKCPVLDTAMDVYQCLKAQPADEFPNHEWWVVQGISQFPFVLVVDGIFLLEAPEISLERQNFKKVPILVGSNKNEGTYFLTYFRQDIFNLKDSALISKSIFRLLLDTLVEYYPKYPHSLNSFGRDAILYQYTHWADPDDMLHNRNMLDQLVADYHFLCQVNEMANAYSAAGQKVYYYHYTHVSSQSPWPEWIGAYHAAEIDFVFGAPMDRNKNYLPNEVELSRKMMRFWSNFAKTGDPNYDWDRPSAKNEWPSHTASGREYILLDAKHVHNFKVSKGLRSKECAFWKEYLPQLVAATLDVSEAEKEWKMQFAEYSQKYIVEWKHQFENFIRNHEKRMANCKHNG